MNELALQDVEDVSVRPSTIKVHVTAEHLAACGADGPNGDGPDCCIAQAARAAGLDVEKFVVGHCVYVLVFRDARQYVFGDGSGDFGLPRLYPSVWNGEPFTFDVETIWMLP